MTAPGFVGADPEQLDALADRFDRAADSLDGVRSTVVGHLGRTHWEGRDAEQFRAEWRGPHTSALVSACGVLRATAQSLRANAAQQRGASHGGGDSLGSGPGAGSGTPAGPNWLRHGLDSIDPLLDGIDGLDWATDLLDRVPFDRALNHFTDLAHLSDVAGPLEVGPLDVLSVGLDVTRLVDEIQAGDVQFGTVFQLAWDGASLYPPIGLVTGAWDTGAFIGEQAANYLQETTHYQDAIYDSIVADRYDGPLTPAQADEMVERYSGLDGYWNITTDLVTSDIHFVSDGVKSLWNKVF